MAPKWVKKGEAKDEEDKGEEKDKTKPEGKGKGKDKGKGGDKGKGKGKEKGKESSEGKGQSKGKPAPDSNRKRLQDRARSILWNVPQGLCGGRLSQLIKEADPETCAAVYGDKEGNLQKGWCQNLLRGLPDVSSERLESGRELMYSLRPSNQYPGMTQAAAALHQRMVSATPAHSMKPNDFMGQWYDSLGHDVQVLQQPKEANFTVIMKQAGRKDIVLSMYPHNMGGGWFSWSCGNSYLHLQGSTSEQLFWSTSDGRASIWMRNPVVQTQSPQPKVDKKPREKKSKAEKDGGEEAKDGSEAPADSEAPKTES